MKLSFRHVTAKAMMRGNLDQSESVVAWVPDQRMVNLPLVGTVFPGRDEIGW